MYFFSSFKTLTAGSNTDLFKFEGNWGTELRGIDTLSREGGGGAGVATLSKLFYLLKRGSS